MEGLWQGGSWAVPVRERYDAVLSLYSSGDHVQEGIRHKHWPIVDGGLPPLDELDDAVRWVTNRWLAGNRVLVRCAAGLNRSGLVVARTLIDAGGSPDEVIDLLRDKRSPHVLCNPIFEKYLRSLS